MSSIKSRVLELAHSHSVLQIVLLTGAKRGYVTKILKMNLGGSPFIKKEVKTKLDPSDIQKGNAKILAKDKVYSTAKRDESKVRVVQLDNRTTKLLYPGQAGYDVPTELLRKDWQAKQIEGLKSLSGNKS